MQFIMIGQIVQVEEVPWWRYALVRSIGMLLYAVYKSDFTLLLDSLPSVNSWSSATGSSNESTLLWLDLIDL